MHINIDLLPHWCLGEWVSEMKKEGQLRRSRVETERTGSSGTLLYSLTASFSSAAFYLFLFWFDYSFSRTGAQAGAHSVIPFSSATGNYMKINWFSMLTSIVNCLSCFNCSSFICRSPGEHFSHIWLTVTERTWCNRCAPHHIVCIHLQLQLLPFEEEVEVEVEVEGLC